MGQLNTLFFFVIDWMLLRSDIEDSLKTLAMASKEINFLLVENSLDPKQMRFPSQPSVFVKDIPAYISEKIEQYEEGKEKSIAFFFLLDGDKDYQTFLAIRFSEDYIILDVSYDFFEPSERMLELYSFCEEVFVKLKAVYGYGTIDYEQWPDKKRIEQIRKGNIDTLYPYNFLGPKLVASIGREHLLAIPAWRITDLENGGLMVIMEHNPFTTDISDPYEQAVTQLNLKKFLDY